MKLPSSLYVLLVFHFLSLAACSLDLQIYPVSSQLELSSEALPLFFKGGSGQTCIKKPEGDLFCWGRGSLSPEPLKYQHPLYDRAVSKVRGGGGVGCGLLGDRELYCWGNNASGALGDGTTISTYIPRRVQRLPDVAVQDFSVGSGYSCALLSDARIFCWGSNLYGKLGSAVGAQSLYPAPLDTSGVLSGKTIVDIEAGNDHACVLTSEEKVYCWGRNNYGQLGNNSTADSSVPVEVDTTAALAGKKVTGLAAGVSHTCVLAYDMAPASAKVYCWGQNYRGSLGVNLTEAQLDMSLVPLEVWNGGALSGKNPATVHAGYGLSCVFTADGKPYCWGNNGSGQVGKGSVGHVAAPVEVDLSGALAGKTLVKLSVGNYLGCVLDSDGLAYCWGSNSFGALGVDAGTSGSSFSPGPVLTSGSLSGQKLLDIEAGQDSACVISDLGQLHCWGGGNRVALKETSSVPVLIGQEPTEISDSDLASVTSMDIRGDHTCFVVHEGSHVYCAGENSNRQLGNGLTQDSRTPVRVQMNGALAALKWTSVSVSSGFSCALSSEQDIYCWGRNDMGQLGDGSGILSAVPVRVNTSKKVLKFSASTQGGCAFLIDQSVVCWGGNTMGQLGDGTANLLSLVPVSIDTSGVLAGKAIQDLTVGLAHSCVRASDRAFCWGYNAGGQVGDGTLSNALVPTAVQGAIADQDVERVVAGFAHTCAVTVDGAAHCWGFNTVGQAGYNGLIEGKKVRDLALGDEHTCAITDDNALYCWGAGSQGQLGRRADQADSPVPVRVDSF